MVQRVSMATVLDATWTPYDKVSGSVLNTISCLASKSCDTRLSSCDTSSSCDTRLIMSCDINATVSRLTVEEHLLFFGQLKGLSWRESMRQIPE